MASAKPDPMGQFNVVPLFGEGTAAWYTLTNVTLWMFLAVLAVVAFFMLGDGAEGPGAWARSDDRGAYLWIRQEYGRKRCRSRCLGLFSLYHDGFHVHRTFQYFGTDSGKFHNHVAHSGNSQPRIDGICYGYRNRIRLSTASVFWACFGFQPHLCRFGRFWRLSK